MLIFVAHQQKYLCCAEYTKTNQFELVAEIVGRQCVCVCVCVCVVSTGYMYHEYNWTAFFNRTAFMHSV